MLKTVAAQQINIDAQDKISELNQPEYFDFCETRRFSPKCTTAEKA
jgi:hypothetical protein